MRQRTELRRIELSFRVETRVNSVDSVECEVKHARNTGEIAKHVSEVAIDRNPPVADGGDVDANSIDIAAMARQTRCFRFVGNTDISALDRRFLIA